MDRRHFIAVLGGAALAWPLVALAQQPAKIPRIGVLSERSPSDAFVAAFRQALSELGYIEGQNIHIEYRYGEGVLGQFPQLARELIGLGIDVLVVGGTIAAQSAKAVTTTVPIVFTLVADPVGSGLVASLARPGGNATGLSTIITELGGKWLELLKAAVPKVSRVAVLYNPARPTARALESLREAAQLDPLIVTNGSPDGIFPNSHLTAQGFYLLRARTQLREFGGGGVVRGRPPHGLRPRFRQ